MPKENRCGIGDETLQLMRDIKFTIYKGIHAGTILDCDSKHKIMVSSINSYLGLMRHYSTYHIRKKLIQHIAHLNFSKGYKKVKLTVP